MINEKNAEKSIIVHKILNEKGKKQLIYLCPTCFYEFGERLATNKCPKCGQKIANNFISKTLF